jgi:hypothetical protein
MDEKQCRHCGVGSSLVYCTTRTARYKLQYRRCNSCGKPDKTRSWIPIERKLTANEIDSLPVLHNLVSDSALYDVFVIVRRKS